MQGGKMYTVGTCLSCCSKLIGLHPRYIVSQYVNGRACEMTWPVSGLWTDKGLTLPAAQKADTLQGNGNNSGPGHCHPDI